MVHDVWFFNATVLKRAGRL